jgi:hypothetical protein
LKNLDDLILENHETSTGIQEISINYTSFGEVYDHSTTIINSCFSTIIAENFLADQDSVQKALGLKQMKRSN